MQRLIEFRDQHGLACVKALKASIWGSVPTAPKFCACGRNLGVGLSAEISSRLRSAPWGLVVQSFHAAADAVAALDEHGHPDIVFLDIALGESDAVEVIRSLGAKHYTGTVQLMSGSKSPLLEDV